MQQLAIARAQNRDKDEDKIIRKSGVVSSNNYLAGLKRKMSSDKKSQNEEDESMTIDQIV